MKKLVSNITSRYFDAANKMRPKTRKQKVIAYVESYDDVSFWRSILSDFETPQLMFEVMLPSRTNLSRGKKTAMMNDLGRSLGTSMIACVDADFDYLLQGASPVSRQMLASPYIFHTYVYAVENYQCYAPGLHNVCVMATLNDRPVFDFEEFLRSYSECVYELLVWAVWLYRQGMYTDFPLTSFNNFITLHNFNLFKPEASLEELRRTVNRKMAWLQRRYPSAKGKLKPLKEELARLGVSPASAYLYIQGHHLFDNVVMTVVGPVCTVLRREREKEIKRLAEHSQQMDNELSSYQHSQCPVEQMLRRNVAFKAAEPYKWLRDDVRKFVDGLLAPQRQEASADSSEEDNGTEEK